MMEQIWGAESALCKTLLQTLEGRRGLETTQGYTNVQLMYTTAISCHAQMHFKHLSVYACTHIHTQLSTYL